MALQSVLLFFFCIAIAAVSEAAPVLVVSPSLPSAADPTNLFTTADRQLHRFSDLDHVVDELTKPCKDLKNVSLALANYCVQCVSARVARAASYGAMSASLLADAAWPINNRTALFARTMQEAFRERGVRDTVQALAELKDFLDMDMTTLQQIAADLQTHADEALLTSKYTRDAEMLLRPELHAQVRNALQFLSKK